MNILPDLPIYLANPAPFRREREPVSGGVPIPFEEAVTSTDTFALYDDHQQSVPCQFTPLAWWPGKERIKWVLLHFQADVPPESTRTYYLRINPQAPHPQASRRCIAAADPGPNHTWIRVDTGKLKAEFGINQPPALSGTGLQLKTADGLLLPGPAQTLQLDENGPERAVVCIKGQFVDADQNPAGFAYTYRFEFYRGHTFVRLFSTITCTAGGQILKDAAWVVPNPWGEAAVYAGTTDTVPEPEAALSGQEIYVLQDTPDQCVYNSGGTSFIKDQRFQGWIHSPEVSAAVRFFWQMFPKSLEADGGQIRVGLLPEKSRIKDEFPPTSEFSGRYHLAVGESRTHELMLCFHSGDNALDPASLNHIFAGFNQPMIPTAPWQWYAQSGALGDLTARAEAFPEFELLADRSLAMILDRRQSLRLYGDRHFGDDLLSQPDVWNNCEYDYPHVGVLMFLRGSGTGWYHEFALPAARHMLNIDIANAGPTSGMVYPHSAQHNSADPTLGSHAWLQGLLEYHVLSGDYLAREVAENTGRLWCRGILASEELYGTERALTWPLIAMLACYQIFAEPEYLKAAQRLKSRVVSLFNHELGHFEGCMMREHYPPSYWQVFLIGSPVLESLVMYDQMFPDEEVRSVIVAIARRLARINWIEELGVWEYPKPRWAQLSERVHTPKNDRMVSPGVGYAYLYSGDQELWEKAVTAFTNRCDQIDQDGKTMAQSLRFGVRMPALMAKVDAKLTGK
ncbi:MAG: hypothetical protein WAQ42_03030 [Limnochordia bacterium]